MREIPLTQGKVAFVDDEDFERISRYKWCATQNKRNWYAVRNSPRHSGRRDRRILMHAEIIGGIGVDHRNRNGLDNRRINLRFATEHQNRANARLSCKNTSGMRGVYWRKEYGKWRAMICVNYRIIHLGHFTDKITAAHARRQAELAYFGEFAP
jgi:hypothetical protein